MKRASKMLLLSMLVLAFLLAACGAQEVVRTVEVEVTRIVTQEVIKEVEVTVQVEGVSAAGPSLVSLSRDIQEGKIDVGEEFGMEPGQRFHTIHVDTIGFACTQCHVQDAPYELAEPIAGSPGLVDRRVCLGCHVSGPATNLYDPKE